MGRGSCSCPPQTYVFSFFDFGLLRVKNIGLQSESKTLARRLSAISLPSGDEGRSPSKVLNPQKHHLAQVQTQEQQQQQFQAVQAKAQRQRTYSSPKHPHPTRIPKARQMSGSSILGSRQTPSQSAENTPKPRQPPTPSSSSSRSTFDLPRSHTRGLGLLHESPPFPIDSVSSSSSTGGGLYTQAHAHGRLSQTQAPKQVEEDPPRPSIDSEERPYEHWYRGEVSRNGGVGELKVGRRKEMLDIANYGHFIRSRKAGNGVGVGAGAAGRENNYLDLLQLRKTRPRAGSIGGLTRKERDSLYLDEMDQEGIVGESGWRGVGGLWTERVLDQDPPTDFDKDDDDDDDDVEEEAEEEAEEGVEENGIEPTRREDSHNDVPHNLNHNYQEEDDDFVLVDHDPQQIASDTQPYPYAYAYIPTESDVVDSSTMAANAIVNINGSSDTNAATRWTSTAGAHQTQQTATYPTNSTTPVTRPSSRQTSPPSRIPHPSSSSRCSSDSRSTHNSASTITPTHATPTQIPPRPARSKSEPPTSLAVASASPSTFNSISIPQGTSPPSAFNMRNTSPGSTSASSSPSPSQLQSPSSTKKTPSSNTTNLRMKPNSRPKAKQKSKSKPPPTKREERSDKRSSVAMYPTVEGGEELADAIPSWMQPVTREGNWDDVRPFFYLSLLPFRLSISL